jgi:hypothetical protein
MSPVVLVAAVVAAAAPTFPKRPDIQVSCCLDVLCMDISCGPWRLSVKRK